MDTKFQFLGIFACATKGQGNSSDTIMDDDPSSNDLIISAFGPDTTSFGKTILPPMITSFLTRTQIQTAAETSLVARLAALSVPQLQPRAYSPAWIPALPQILVIKSLMP
jgi:hypothetical protein